MTPENEIVIVGAGHAGTAAAIALREEGFGGKISLISSESTLPYHRPPLSKAYLRQPDTASAVIRPEAFYTSKSINLMLGRRAIGIDTRKQYVLLESGDAIHYDHLILATGSRERNPPFPLPPDGRVMRLRDLEDANGLRDAILGARKMAIVGAGFIGLEVAATAAGLGLDVTVIEPMDRLLARTASQAVSDVCMSAHLSYGTKFRTKCAVTSIEKAEDGHLVLRLSNGETLYADLVLLSIGVIPDDHLAREAGLTVDEKGGVVVNTRLTSSDPYISVIGDAAVFPYAGANTRVTSIQNATDQGKLVARALTGKETHYHPTLTFWSEQKSLKLQMAVRSFGANRFVTRSAGDNSLSVFGFENGVLVQVETINNAKNFMLARALFDKAIGPTFTSLETVNFELAKIEATSNVNP